MKKIKAVKLGLICALCFSLISTPAYAEPVEGITETENIESTENVENIENNITSDSIPEDVMQNDTSEETTETASEATSEETQQVIEETTSEKVETATDTSKDENTNPNKDENKLTKSWITLSTSNKNVTVKGGDHFTVTLVLQNVDTQEIYKEVLSTEDQLSKTFILPNGTYKVSIEEETVTDEYCLMEDTLVADGGEIIFDIVFKNLSKDIVYPPTDIDKTPAWQIILKNNMVFITLLVGCGIYLLVRKIQKSREE